MINNTHREKVEFNTSIYQIAILHVQTFPEFNIFHFFLFRLDLRAFINTLVIYPQKINHHFQLIFQAILRLFSIEGHDQTSLKLTFIIFRFVFTK